MINLVLKDFILQKKVAIISVFYGLAITFVSSASVKSDSAIIISVYMNAFFIITMTYFSVLYADGYDEKNKAFYIINSLPIKKRHVATSKYISLLVYIMSYSIIITILSFLCKLIIKEQNSSCVYSIIIAFITLSFIYSIYYPLYFKFGMETLKIYKIFMVFFICIIPSSIVNKLKSMDKAVVENMVIWIQSNFNILMIMALLISIVFLILSWVFSIRIYGKKDF